MNRIDENLTALLGTPMRQTAKQPVAVKQRAEELMAHLDQKSVIGLYGMGGIGKTTIASELWNQRRSDFGLSCSFVEVGQNATGPAELCIRQARLCTDLYGKPMAVASVSDGQGRLEAISHTKKLVVLDDIWERRQLDCLLRPLLTAGIGQSKIIITTRNKELLESFPLQRAGQACMQDTETAISTMPPGIYAHEITCLEADDSMKLFASHAFGCGQPPMAFQDITGEVVAACGGLPLSLEVIGSLLRNRDYSAWTDCLARLHSANTITSDKDDQLFAKLQISYDSLDEDWQRVLLHVAYFFLRDQNIHTCNIIWGMGSKSIISSLQRRCLLSLCYTHTFGQSDSRVILKMHDQLQAMAEQQIKKKGSEYERLEASLEEINPLQVRCMLQLCAELMHWTAFSQSIHLEACLKL